jgi:hypothetical protein
MTTIVKLNWPTGAERGSEEVDLDTLTPKSRALAEAIAGRTLGRIHLLSVRPMRDMYRPGDAARIHGADSPKLDDPMRDSFESWAHRPATGGYSLHQMLEYEARKFPRWYPVAEGWTELPSSTAARDDDGVTVEQALEIIRTVAPNASIDKDRWMRKATKGDGGYPKPARHNGYQSLWSEAEVRAFAERVAAIQQAAVARQQSVNAEREATGRLRELVTAAAADDVDEDEVRGWASLNRGTVRTWLGK